MELTGVPEPRINWDASNLPNEWTTFKDHIDLIFAGPLKSKSEEEKCTYLLLWIGQRGREIHKSWNLTADDNKSLKKLSDSFKAYVVPKLNSVFKRYQFNNIVQGGCSLEEFFTKLRVHANDCKFNANREEMMRDRIVFGVRSDKIRGKLLSEGDKLTYGKAIEIAQSHDYAQKQLQSITAKSEATMTNTAVCHVRNSGVKPNKKGQTRRKVYICEVKE